eukprot:2402704-Amphidinium_carterae.4
MVARLPRQSSRSEGHRPSCLPLQSHAHSLLVVFPRGKRELRPVNTLGQPAKPTSNCCACSRFANSTQTRGNSCVASYLGDMHMSGT